MNRRAFIAGLWAFMILPGAGRIWKVQRNVTPFHLYTVRSRQLVALTEQESRDFLNLFFFGKTPDGYHERLTNLHLRTFDPDSKPDGSIITYRATNVQPAAATDRA